MVNDGIFRILYRCLGTLGGTIGEHIPGDSTCHAFVVSGGTMHDLGTLPGFSNSIATSINGSGQIAGYPYVPGPTPARAFLYGGVMTDLGTLGGDTSFAQGINAFGRVAGSSALTGNADDHAFLTAGA
jgi:probable HAF family extracellular repeat protein